MDGGNRALGYEQPQRRRSLTAELGFDPAPWRKGRTRGGRGGFGIASWDTVRLVSNFTYRVAAEC